MAKIQPRSLETGQLNSELLKLKKKNPCTGPEGSRTLRVPNFKTIGTLGWYGYQPNALTAFIPPKNIPDTYFC